MLKPAAVLSRCSIMLIMIGVIRVGESFSSNIETLVMVHGTGPIHPLDGRILRRTVVAQHAIILERGYATSLNAKDQILNAHISFHNP
jgi:hypothetical protein